MDSDTSVELGDHALVAAVESLTTNASTSVQTVADVQPTEDTITEELPSTSKSEESPIQKCLDSTSDSDNSQTVETPAVEILAVADTETYITERGDVLIFGLYIRQDIADGSIFTAGEKFTQTWVVRNDGFVSWPVGTTLTFSGGDNMSGTVVTVTDFKVESGKEFNFSVDFVAPVHTSGRLISYWSLCTADGIRFGPQLWCDIGVKEKEIAVKEVEVVEAPKEEKIVEKADEPREVVTVVSETEEEAEAVPEALAASHVSEMIFPTLDTEAPVPNPNTAPPTESTSAIPDTAAVAPSTLDDVSDTVSEGYSIDDEDDLENFISDEEDYEVLMASDDEEFGSNASNA
jgi:next-to-BRCA1 protein 1